VSTVVSAVVSERRREPQPVKGEWRGVRSCVRVVQSIWCIRSNKYLRYPIRIEPVRRLYGNPRPPTQITVHLKSYLKESRKKVS